MLTDNQIVTLLSRDGSREDMLREAWRMGEKLGMLRAAELCDRMGSCALMPEVGKGRYQCADAIRAEAESC